MRDDHASRGSIPPPMDPEIVVESLGNMNMSFLARPEIEAALASGTALKAQVAAFLELSGFHSDPAGDPLILLGIDPSSPNVGMLSSQTHVIEYQHRREYSARLFGRPVGA